MRKGRRRGKEGRVKQIKTRRRRRVRAEKDAGNAGD